MYVRILKKLSKYNKVNYERSNTPFLENYRGLNYSCSTNYYTNWLKMFRRSWGLYIHIVYSGIVPMPTVLKFGSLP